MKTEVMRGEEQRDEERRRDEMEKMKEKVNQGR